MISLQHRFADDLPELSVAWHPGPLGSPMLVAFNDDLALELGLDGAALRSPAGVRELLGHDLAPGARPVSQVYSGHQFGGFSPRLGDGRAVLLGEFDTPRGRRDLHLKGSGPTPLSRGGDGLAALGPMLRELLVSESLHALGIPTTRSLAVLGTGRQVPREDGPHPGAVLVRTAASHLRVGSFQFARASGDIGLLRRLLDFSIARHCPQAATTDNPALTLFAQVRDAQARLVAQWMQVGFVHGVMNTDNMTISGESIDFGPCAFMDAYDPGTVFSSIDDRGRYAYGNQPPIAQWNLARFAECLLPLIHDDEEQAIAAAMEVLDGYAGVFNEAWLAGIGAKLGLSGERPDPIDDEALTALAGELLDLAATSRADWTGLWVALSEAARSRDLSTVWDLVTDRDRFDGWGARWLSLRPDPEQMDATNPVRIPRNHLVDSALTAAESGDGGPFDALLAAVRDPYRVRAEPDPYAEPAPDAFARGFRTFCGT